MITFDNNYIYLFSIRKWHPQAVVVHNICIDVQNQTNFTCYLLKWYSFSVSISTFNLLLWFRSAIPGVRLTLTLTLTQMPGPGNGRPQEWGAVTAFIAWLNMHWTISLRNSHQRGTSQHIVVPKHSQDHADSEYVSYVAVDRKGAEFTVTNNFIYYIQVIFSSSCLVKWSFWLSGIQNVLLASDDM